MLSNSYSAEYGGLAGVVVTTKRGSSAYRGTAFYDFNSDGLNALTYNQTLSGVERGDPLSDTHEHRWGASLGGPLFGSKLFFFGNYEGSNDKAIFGGGRATVPTRRCGTATSAALRSRPTDPLTGEPFPNQMIPANRIDPAATEDHELLLSAAESGRPVDRRLRRLPAVRARNAEAASAPTSGSTTRRARTTRCSCAAAISTATPNSITFEGGQRAHEPADPRIASSTPASVDRRMDEDLSADDGQRVPRRLQLRQVAARRARSTPPTWRRSSASRTRRASAPDRLGFPSFNFTDRHQPADEHRRRRPQRRPHASTRTRSRSATT